MYFNQTISCLFLIRPYVKPPLFNMEFFIMGDLVRSKDEIEKKIKKLGGKVATQVHDELAAIISNYEEVHKRDVDMIVAELCGIHVVSVNFLTEVERGEDPITRITANNLCDWSGDVRFIRSAYYIFNNFIISTENRNN